MVKIEGPNLEKLLKLKSELSPLEEEVSELEEAHTTKKVIQVPGSIFGFEKSYIDQARIHPRERFDLLKKELISKTNTAEKILSELEISKIIKKEWGGNANNINHIDSLVFSYLDLHPKTAAQFIPRDLKIMLGTEIEFEPKKYGFSYARYLFQLMSDTKPLDESAVEKIKKRLKYAFHQNDLSFFREYSETIGVYPEIKCEDYEKEKGKIWKLHQTAEEIESRLKIESLVIPKWVSDEEGALILSNYNENISKLN